MTAIDLSSYVGLAALCLLTLNILLGLLVSVDYQPQRHWPYRHFSAFKLHNWTGYIALCVALLHPVILLFSKTAGFRVLDIAFPIKSPSQPVENTLGAAALYCLALVVVTSYYRVAIGLNLWKRLHYFAYAAARRSFSSTACSPTRFSKTVGLIPSMAKKCWSRFAWSRWLSASLCESATCSNLQN